MTATSISPDGQAIALACSTLAMGGERSVKPLNSREWHELSARLVRSEWGSPSELLGCSSAELRRGLDLAPETAERLAQLLARGGQLAFELERLANSGIWVLTRADEEYPQRVKKLLASSAPPVLYGAGPQTALREQALAIVGSRDADSAALVFVRAIARRCVSSHVAVVSGAARGVDLEAMGATIEAGGMAVGVSVDPLERLVRRPALRGPLAEGTLTLMTPFHPAARWQVGNAMGRNRIIYAMSNAAVVAATAAGSGGTWTGAIENLRFGWVPLYVRAGKDEGSRALARAGAIPLAEDTLEDIEIAALFARPDAPRSSAQQTFVGDEPGGETISVMRISDRQSQQASTQTLETTVAEETSPADHLHNRRSQDAFWAIWPLLDVCLRAPHSDRDVAEALNVQLGQARVWLDRAVEEHLVRVEKGRRKLYIACDASEDQLKLA
ncbi:MAG: DNA-processing protein DprA [Solirubrobacteraceae bacterium]